MSCLLNLLEQTYTDETDQLMVKKLHELHKRHWKGLFTCYDHPHVPRTNNHVRFSRKTKTRHRRMRGLRSWNEYINCSGEFVVSVVDALRQKDLLKRLQSVSYKTFREELPIFVACGGVCMVHLQVRNRKIANARTGGAMSNE